MIDILRKLPEIMWFTICSPQFLMLIGVFIVIIFLSCDFPKFSIYKFFRKFKKKKAIKVKVYYMAAEILKNMRG